MQYTSFSWASTRANIPSRRSAFCKSRRAPCWHGLPRAPLPPPAGSRCVSRGAGNCCWAFSSVRYSRRPWRSRFSCGPSSTRRRAMRRFSLRSSRCSLRLLRFSSFASGLADGRCSAPCLCSLEFLLPSCLGLLPHRNRLSRSSRAACTSNLGGDHSNRNSKLSRVGVILHVDGVEHRCGGGVGFFISGDVGLVEERGADVVEAFEQDFFARRDDFKFVAEAVIIADRLVGQVDAELVAFFFFGALEEFFDLRFAQFGGKNAVLEAIVVEN